jgi:hypothetical protein
VSAEAGRAGFECRERGHAVQSIAAGVRVIVQTAAGSELEKIALGGVTMGHDFPVVWACRADEWESARAEGREPNGVPWPAEDVRLR